MAFLFEKSDTDTSASHVIAEWNLNFPTDQETNKASLGLSHNRSDLKAITKQPG